MPHKVQTRHDFRTKGSKFHQRRQSIAAGRDASAAAANLNDFYVGLAMAIESDGRTAIGIALNDGTYSVDFSVHHISAHESEGQDSREQAIVHLAIAQLSHCETELLGKVIGAGVTTQLDKAAPTLCSRLWAQLDIVPLVMDAGKTTIEHSVDEKADSVARRCLMHFGPTKQPRLDISLQNEVRVDSGGRARLTTLGAYQKSVHERTWNAVSKCVQDVKGKNLRIAFFSATPQGGGVALMRHALLRFLHLQDIHAQWFVPKPSPDIFRITKTNHNILQGAVPPDVRVSDKQLASIETWMRTNADRYWLKEGGPLLAPSAGGADVIIIDDPQMPVLIPIAKGKDAKRPVIFRSHIEIRDDLVKEDGSAAHQVWSWMWEFIQDADVFISHPVKSFVPSAVQDEILGWMPATTDWLDGLNKNMREWDVQYYLSLIRQQCQAQGQPQLAHSSRSFIAQIARFDPSKGIPDVVNSYAKLRIALSGKKPEVEPPQLVVCGHSSIDDPDGALIFDQTMDMIQKDHAKLQQDVILLRLGPSDQLLNAVISTAKVVLQLSTREGFEVKVSEALHKGKPVIATLAGGIPLQVEHEKNGFLVPRGDTDAVAQHLTELLTDHTRYRRMAEYAKHSVSDEVHTVGNALNWLYLASALSEKGLKPNRRWINDLAREWAGEPYSEQETRLPRHLST